MIRILLRQGIADLGSVAAYLAKEDLRDGFAIRIATGEPRVTPGPCPVPRGTGACPLCEPSTTGRHPWSTRWIPSAGLVNPLAQLFITTPVREEAERGALPVGEILDEIRILERSTGLALRHRVYLDGSVIARGWSECDRWGVEVIHPIPVLLDGLDASPRTQIHIEGDLSALLALASIGLCPWDPRNTQPPKVTIVTPAGTTINPGIRNLIRDNGGPGNPGPVEVIPTHLPGTPSPEPEPEDLGDQVGAWVRKLRRDLRVSVPAGGFALGDVRPFPPTDPTD